MFSPAITAGGSVHSLERLSKIQLDVIEDPLGFYLSDDDMVIPAGTF